MRYHLGMKANAKSLRFSEAEEAEIRDYLKISGEQEAVMLERAAIRGLREERLEKGFLALVGGASSSEAATIAGLDRHAFLTEAVEKGIPLLDDGPEDMLRDLGQLAVLFEDERLAAAVETVSRKLLCSGQRADA
jgi:hypothetical protein